MDDTDIRALLLRDMEGRDRSWWLALQLAEVVLRGESS